MMRKDLQSALISWPKGYITDTDLSVIINRSDASRYGIVNRALKEGVITRIKRGLYTISTPRREPVDLLEIAQFLYGPSVVSLESSLRYHSLIPEAVQEVTSVTLKRSNEFSTPLGVFSYTHVPQHNFLLGVERIERNRSSFLVAGPWKAIADIIYIRRKEWTNVEQVCNDLRIELEALTTMGTPTLVELAKGYPNTRTQALLNRFIRELI